MSREFYSREQFEKIDQKIKDERDFIREFGSQGDLSQDDNAALEDAARVKIVFEQDRERMLNRAWTEALKENEKFDAEINANQFRERLDREYEDARNKFVQFAKDEKWISQKLTKPVNVISELGGVSEILLLSPETDLDVCRAELYYPRDIGNGEYEEGRIEIVVEKNGALRGIQNIPPVIRVLGPGKILFEIMRCLQKERYTRDESSEVVTITIGDEFVPEGEGESKPSLDEQNIDDLRNFPVELDQMRFEILSSQEHGLIFRCVQGNRQGWSRGAYEAFIYSRYVIFEPARYGHATYTMVFDESMGDDLIAQIQTESDSERRNQLCIEALESKGFFEEIRLGKDERREQGKRYTKNHRWKRDGEGDDAYFERLKEYYNELFSYLESAATKKETPA